jgi:restriction system protein
MLNKPFANKLMANQPEHNLSASLLLWERFHRDVRNACQPSRWNRSHRMHGGQRLVLQSHLPKPAKRNAVQLPSFKMSEKSLFAVLLRSPWWISFALAVAVGAGCYKLFPDRFAVVGALSGLPFAIIGCIAIWKQRGIPNPARIEAALQALSGLSARDFSSALAAAYVKDGYLVAKLTASGADMSISKAGRTALVHSKRWKAATHGIEPLRELAASMEAAEANSGVYIAVNTLSDAARVFASKNSIRVMQGTELALLMKPELPK